MKFEKEFWLCRPLSQHEVEDSVENSINCAWKHHTEAWDSMKKFQITDQLQNIEIPTLMITTAGDRYNQARFNFSLLMKNLQDYQLLPLATLHVFSRVSHDAPREIPEDMSKVIIDFLIHGVITYKTKLTQFMEKYQQFQTQKSKL